MRVSPVSSLGPGATWIQGIRVPWPVGVDGALIHPRLAALYQVSAQKHKAISGYLWLRKLQRETVLPVLQDAFHGSCDSLHLLLISFHTTENTQLQLPLFIKQILISVKWPINSLLCFFWINEHFRKNKQLRSDFSVDLISLVQKTILDCVRFPCWNVKRSPDGQNMESRASVNGESQSSPTAARGQGPIESAITKTIYNHTQTLFYKWDFRWQWDTTVLFIYLFILEPCELLKDKCPGLSCLQKSLNQSFNTHWLTATETASVHHRLHQTPWRGKRGYVNAVSSLP